MSDKKNNFFHRNQFTNQEVTILRNITMNEINLNNLKIFRAKSKIFFVLLKRIEMSLIINATSVAADTLRNDKNTKVDCTLCTQ